MPRTDENGFRPRRSDPTLTEVIRTAQRAASLKLRVAVPATVQAYNATTQRVDVSCDFLPVRYNDTGEVTQAQPLVLSEIPVSFPGSALGSLTFPISPGDTGQVIVCDRSLEKWNQTGIPDAPPLKHAHNLIDGVFYPGLKPKAKATPVSTAATVVDGPLVFLGGNASSPLVLGDALLQELLAYATTVLSAFATWQGIVPPTALSNGAFLAAIGGATTDLAASLPGVISTKSFSE